MSHPAPLLDILRTVDTPAADSAVAVAIEHLQPAQIAPLAELLLARAQPSSYHALIECLHLLDAPLQARVRDAGEHMRASLAELMRTGSSQARINVLELIDAQDSASLSYLAIDALMDRSGNVRQQAARTIKRLTDSWFDRANESRVALYDPDATDEWRTDQLKRLHESRAVLVRTIQGAVERFNAHHHLEVLEAAMYFAEDLAASLFEPPAAHRSRMHHAMLQVFGSSLDPRLAVFAYKAIEYPELRPGVIASLSARRDSAFFAEMIREHWRARLPAARAALGTLHSLAWLQDGIAPLVALPEDMHAAGIDWLGQLGLPDDKLIDLLRGALDFECAEGLASCAWVAARRHNAASDNLLSHLASSPHPEAARIAQIELARRHRLIARRANDGPESNLQWNDFLRRHGMEDRFDSIWAAADRLIQSGTPGAGALLMARMPEFVPSMRLKLCAPNTPDRVRAHRLVAALHLEATFQSEIFKASDDADAVVRSMAVSAVTKIGDATSRRILERCVNDNDAHVRAGAIEALASLGGNRVASLLSARLTDESPDVRSCAIRVLLRQRVPQAAETLIQMLKDSRREHRLAALALVSNMQLTAMQRRLAVMAEMDPDKQVQQRAARILKAWNVEPQTAGAT